jgi:phosphate transport system ATP-binding protein
MTQQPLTLEQLEPLELQAPVVAPRRPSPAPTATPPLRMTDFSASYAGRPAVAGVTLDIPAQSVTAFIGPSGCGKSTLLRSINRLHETIPQATTAGRIELHGEDVYGPGVDPVVVRQRVGMVFQRANPFPAMSIRDNVLAGAKLRRQRLSKTAAAELAESALRAANLWDEVKDRLRQPGAGLSGGQQQRLCIARAIAAQPEIILMDEPCSALDPISTLAIEELMATLRRDYTVVIVTHNMQQAARISDQTAFFSASALRQPGRLIEYDDTTTVFSHPGEQATADYIAGRFG